MQYIRAEDAQIVDTSVYGKVIITKKPPYLKDLSMSQNQIAMNELYRLLDLAEEECSAGEIGGMISHSKDYEECLAKVENALLKLEKYQEAEEEVRSNFYLLAKAKENGIYRKMADGIEFYPSDKLSVYIDHIMVSSGKLLYIFEYGKLWALTKEELQ